MSFFKKMFGSQDDEAQNVGDLPLQNTQTSNEISIEEQFSLAFKSNGGKFLYCETFDDVKTNFEDILQENDWYESEVMCNEAELYSMLDENKLNYTDNLQPLFMFATCESLIAEDGSVLFCSNQIKQYKPDQFCTNLIVFSTTSRIVADKTAALNAFQKRYRHGYPSNMTALKYFEKTQNEDFLHYGSIPKNIYLLLLEDQ